LGQGYTKGGNKMSGTAQDHVVQHAVEMCEGNPGAASALAELIKASNGPYEALSHMKYLKDHNITGSMIWLWYKDVCKHDAADMVRRIEAHDMASDLERLPYGGYKAP
jgi:hypothetical protein